MGKVIEESPPAIAPEPAPSADVQITEEPEVKNLNEAELVSIINTARNDMDTYLEAIKGLGVTRYKAVVELTRLHSIPEVADLLGLSRQAIYQILKRGAGDDAQDAAGGDATVQS